MASSLKPLVPRSVRATAWDPSCPYRLFLLPESSSSASEKDELLTPFYSHDGVGCNTWERSALMQLLDGGGTHHDDEESSHETPTMIRNKYRVKFESQTYRRALQKCLLAWQEHQMMDTTTNTKDASSLELLQLVYAVTHLTEIFLFSGNSNQQGAVTADTVRYLRHHHMDDVEIPEDTSGTTSEGEYWSTVKSLVLRGCLEDAWALLSRHFLCIRCFQTSQETLDEYDRQTLREDRDGFLVLRALLATAPLPGGRHDGNDEGFTLLPREEEEENDENQEPIFLEGIPADAYQLWEASSTNAAAGASRMSDRPLEYDAYAATSTFQAWRRMVNEHTSSTLIPLIRRLPQLQSSVLNILSGQLEDNVVFRDWSEAFCAELLYQRPQLCPQDMATRAKRVMDKFGPTDAFQNVLISVMQGNAGRVVSVLHDLGGGSGAALPATMTTLLCSLLTEAGELPKADPPAFSIQTELLLSASESILSSLSKESDLAVRLSTKLLLPHATPENDARITATLAETLSRYAPKTDAEVRTLLSLCRPLVKRKSRRVLDGCVNLVLTRHSDTLPRGHAVHWLLRGIDLELLLFCENRDEGAWETVLASGQCGFILRSECITSAKSLLLGLLGETSESAVGQHYVKATDMVSVLQNDADLSDFCQTIPEVQLLIHTQNMAKAIVEDEGDRVVAAHIAACLDDKKRGAGEAVSCLAHSSMQWELLLLAYTILKRDEDLSERADERDRHVASFDVQGMRCLMERFAQVKLSREEEKATKEVDPMRHAMGKGLMRAFVAENAKKKDAEFQFAGQQQRVGSVLSSKLSSHSRLEQESIVRAMLDPSM